MRDLTQEKKRQKGNFVHHITASYLALQPPTESSDTKSMTATFMIRARLGKVAVARHIEQPARLVSSSSLRAFSSLPCNARNGLTSSGNTSSHRIAAVARPMTSPIRSFSSSVSFREAEAFATSQSSGGVMEEETGKDGAVAFSTLKGVVSDSTYKSLTKSPFNYTMMSEVQSNILPKVANVTRPLPGSLPAPSSTASQDEEPIDGSQGPTDLLVKARTGTGKTLAFLVPALEARLKQLSAVKSGKLFPPAFRRLLLKKQPDFDWSSMSASAKDGLENIYATNTVGALIISPTRELATQIAAEAKKLATNQRNPPIDVQVLVGGESKNQQIRDWTRGAPDIVVATPGRILDLASENSMIRSALSATETLILDEADTLLELGFKEAIQEIQSLLPSKEMRRNLLFSATVSKEIRGVAHQMLNRDYDYVDCVPEGAVATHERIPQFAHIVEPEAHISTMLKLAAHDQLIHGAKSKIIIFCPTGKLTRLVAGLFQANDVRRMLPEYIMGAMQNSNGRRGSQRNHGSSDIPRSLNVLELHSGLEQSRRSRVSDEFRHAKTASVLITSDVSARGVDYPNVTRVIQVGCAASKDQYIHRVGRTGRAGKEGRGDTILLKGWEDNWVSVEGNGLPLQVSTSGSQLADDLQQAWDAKRQQGARLPEDCAILGSDTDILAVARESLLGPTGERLARSLRLDLDGRRAPSAEDIADEVLKDVHRSMFGFYLSLMGALRTSGIQIAEGVAEFGERGLMLSPEQAQIPRAMLQRLGGNKSRGGSSSGRFGDRGGSREGFGGFGGDRGSRGGSFGNDRRSRGGDGGGYGGGGRGDFGRGRGGRDSRW
ncbi:unnamed protein product [Sympodiomycopsis kandeliae]